MSSSSLECDLKARKKKKEIGRSLQSLLPCPETTQALPCLFVCTFCSSFSAHFPFHPSHFTRRATALHADTDTHSPRTTSSSLPQSCASPFSRTRASSTPSRSTLRWNLRTSRPCSRQTYVSKDVSLPHRYQITRFCLRSTNVGAWVLKCQKHIFINRSSTWHTSPLVQYPSRGASSLPQRSRARGSKVNTRRQQGRSGRYPDPSSTRQETAHHQHRRHRIGSTHRRRTFGPPRTDLAGRRGPA